MLTFVKNFASEIVHSELAVFEGELSMRDIQRGGFCVRCAARISSKEIRDASDVFMIQRGACSTARGRIELQKAIQQTNKIVRVK